MNETDVRLVEKNFLKVGPTASEGEQPKDTIGKKGITDFLKMVGLFP